jgi:2-desacetyl-2-hydroxyethyl bacteriochlorophyllide A dehydrogenase
VCSRIGFSPGSGHAYIPVNNAAVLFEGPRRVVVADVEKHEPAQGELLVETISSVISTGTELTALAAEDPPGTVWASLRRFPNTPGYCNAGRVVAAGSEADRDWVGKRVASVARHMRFGVIPVGAARPLPDDRIGDDEAAFSSLAETVINGVRRGGVSWGESVVVFGLGLLGQLAVRFCRLAGARPVFAVDVAEERLALVPDDTGIVRVRADEEDVDEVVSRATRGRMADVAFEVTGVSDLIPREIVALHPQGRFVVLSSPRGKGTLFNFHDLCNRPSYTIIGAHVSSHPEVATPEQPWTAARNAELFFDLLCDGALELKPLISHRYAYREAPEAYAALLADRSRAMGVILDWRED